MKKIAILCCIMLAGLPCAIAQKSKGMYFENDSLAIICAKAQREGKIVFIDAYTSWCGPCKWMAANIFTNDTVGTFYNANFINVQIQIDMEKGEGPAIADSFDVQCYPTFLFIDGTGKVVHRQSGSCSVQQFISLGMDALNPQKQYATLEKKYESGTATTVEFISYMEMRQATCLPIEKEVSDYDGTQAETDFASKQNWAVLYILVTDLNSRMFQYMLAHREVYDASYTADSVNQVITKVYGTVMSQCLWKQEPDTVGYKKLRDEVIALDPQAFDKLVLGYDISLYRITKDWNTYAQTTILYIQKYAAQDDYNLLNNCAWGFYENVDNTAYLDTAIAWAKKSVEIQPMWFNTDTYASLLYKRGNYKEALIQAKAAIKRGKQEGSDYSTTEKLLEQIEKAIKNK